jgi:hypothetical protein
VAGRFTLDMNAVDLNSSVVREWEREGVQKPKSMCIFIIDSMLIFFV